MSKTPNKDKTIKNDGIKQFKAVFTKVQYECLISSLNAVVATYGIKSRHVILIIKKYELQFSSQKKLGLTELTITHKEAEVIQQAIDGVLMSVARQKIDIALLNNLNDTYEIVLKGFADSGGELSKK